MNPADIIFIGDIKLIRDRNGSLWIQQEAEQRLKKLDPYEEIKLIDLLESLLGEDSEDL